MVAEGVLAADSLLFDLSSSQGKRAAGSIRVQKILKQVLEQVEEIDIVFSSCLFPEHFLF